VRVLHVIQEMRTGGAERVVISLARGASAAGHEVAVASSGGELVSELDSRHYLVPLVRRRPTAVPRAVGAVMRAIRDWSPDLVHCHNPGMAAVTSLATWRGRRTPTLVSVHGVPESDWRATARVLRVAGLPAVACGPGVAAALAEEGLGVLETIVNGISPSPPPAERAAVTTELGLPAATSVVLAVGRLVDAKNHALAIRAIAETPGAALVILGEGPERDSLTELAAELDVGDRVVLAGLRTDARELMGAADVVVFTSRAEGLPLAALEALSSGTPVVAVAVRGLRELLQDEQSALLVPPDDHQALSAALRRVLIDANLAHALGGKGRSIAQQYTEDGMVSSFLELYTRLARR
jgi:glycosyltransferase involved in cell wall biosynthesis